MKIIQHEDKPNRPNITAKIRSLLIIPANLLILSFNSTKIKLICVNTDDRFKILPIAKE